MGIVTTIANLAEAYERLRILLYVCILGLNATLCVYPALALVSPETEGISSANQIGAFATAITIAVLASLFLMMPVRRLVARFLPKPPKRNNTPVLPARPVPLMNTLHNGIVEMEAVDPKARIISGGSHAWQPKAPRVYGGFRPESMIHMWAGVVVLYFIGLQMMNLFLADGLSGLAEDIGVDYSSLIANFLPTVIIPLMGVGLFMRRNLRQTLNRLGIYPLSWQELAFRIGVSALVTFGLVVWVLIVGLIWQASVSEETYNEQSEAADALAESITTVGLAFMVAFTAGVGEEIAFRGAMQPIFGFWSTTIVFVAAHTQYTLTPAWLIILVVAIAFGLLRKYFDTSTAILTHFLYNFTLLILVLVSPEVSWLTM
jgi:membrane protease YdiL (CAAX protease family)